MRDNNILLRIIFLTLASSLFLLTPLSAFACDLCAIYIPLESSESSKASSIHLGLAQQYTSYDHLRDRGRRIDNPYNQFLRSSITQAFVAYDLDDSISLQANLPFIYRSYRRIEDQDVVKGHESGIGDIVLLSRFRVYSEQNTNSALKVSLFAGVKLPTGDSDRIFEEISASHAHEGSDLDIAHEDHDDDHDMHTDTEMHSDADPDVDTHTHSAAFSSNQKHSDSTGSTEHSSMLSAVHGHDLALGTGSVDFPLGISVQGQYSRWITDLELQYVFRTAGRYDFTYANDLNWSLSAGRYLLMQEQQALALKINLLGEYKPEDSLNGNSLIDTYSRTVFWGPELMLNLSDRFSAHFAFDLPIDSETKAVQVAQTNRIRTAVSWRF